MNKKFISLLILFSLFVSASVFPIKSTFAEVIVPGCKECTFKGERAVGCSHYENGKDLYFDRATARVMINSFDYWDKVEHSTKYILSAISLWIGKDASTTNTRFAAEQAKKAFEAYKQYHEARERKPGYEQIKRISDSMGSTGIKVSIRYEQAASHMVTIEIHPWD